MTEYLIKRLRQIAHKLEHASAIADEAAALYILRPEALADVRAGILDLHQIERAYARGGYEAIVNEARRELEILVQMSDELAADRRAA